MLFSVHVHTDNFNRRHEVITETYTLHYNGSCRICIYIQVFNWWHLSKCVLTDEVGAGYARRQQKIKVVKQDEVKDSGKQKTKAKKKT